MNSKLIIIKKVITAIIAFNFLLNNAQSNLNFSKLDSMKTRSKKGNTFIKKSIIPLSLISIGAFINYTDGQFGKERLNNRIQKNLDFNTEADDYLIFVPALEMYAANLLHIKSKNTIANQTKYLLVSNIATLGATQILKRSFNEERPDKSDNRSFPSGHTAHAFVMATVLHHEYKDSNKFLAYSGYAFAVTTATFRMLNNRHFPSDVLVGAGLGIAITELVYSFNPLQRWQPFKNKKRQVFISPIYRDDAFGVISVIRF